MTERKVLRAALIALGVVALLLAATADEGVFGLGTDGRIMLRTAVAIAELGEIGIARGQAVGVARDEGDAVTRYGMGPSLVLAVPAYVAGWFERAFGAGSSQTLFVLTQILLLLAAAASAGALASAWGAGERGVGRAILGGALASPLFAYAGSDFSEPLQAACVGGAFAAAMLAVRPDSSPRGGALLALLAGALAGWGLLTKSILIVLLPAVLAVLWFGGERGGRVRRLAAALGAWLGLAPVWLVFEIVRFGRPFTSYEGERFNHLLLDGLWRLTVGPNKGFLLYFPLALLAVAGWMALLKSRRSLAFVVLGFTGFFLLLTSAWWAWDGTFGWGPRLLLSLVPLLAALAAIGAERFPPAVFAVLFSLGLAVNAVGVLQPATLTSWYFRILERRPLTEEDAARYPRFTYERTADGRRLLYPQYDVARHAGLSPIRVSSWLLLRRVTGRNDAASLRTPPWRTDVPGQRVALPPEQAIPPADLVHLTAPFRWPHLGMSLGGGRSREDRSIAFIEALLDQALRAQDMRRPDRAVDFAERVFSLFPNPQTAVVLAESYRLAGRREALADFAAAMQRRKPVDSDLGVVLALAARDRGDEAEARRILEAVASGSGRPELTALLALSPREWPATLREITAPRHTP